MWTEYDDILVTKIINSPPGRERDRLIDKFQPIYNRKMGRRYMHHYSSKIEDPRTMLNDLFTYAIVSLLKNPPKESIGGFLATVSRAYVTQVVIRRYDPLIGGAGNLNTVSIDDQLTGDNSLNLSTQQSQPCDLGFPRLEFTIKLLEYVYDRGEMPDKERESLAAQIRVGRDIMRFAKDFELEHVEFRDMVLWLKNKHSNRHIDMFLERLTEGEGKKKVINTSKSLRNARTP